MNRSTIGEILAGYGMELHYFTHGENRNTYHVYRKPSRWNVCTLKTPFFTIQNVYDIYLCANEVLVTGNFDDLRVNIPYRFLDKFEIRGFVDE